MSSQAISNDVTNLLEDLEQATTLKKRGKATKRVLDILDSDKKLVSWKFNEWDYAKDKIKLPSNARGLFTLLDEPKIAVRGYDKFFNIDEVYFTRWEWLKENTAGPYYVTAKENGCIILISGLQDGTIVVCSKHSTGSREDTSKNHAIAGQKFLEKQLNDLNLSTKDLALKLFELNVTAVAEFCDDDFEEHIIEYKGRDAGLYLHGLNFNKPIFETYEIKKVNEFANQWGFKTIEYFTEIEINELQNTLSRYSKSGSYNNKEIEGFVIRCKKKSGEDYFFKFKFEEPYLMYRQWREVTKEYISHKSRSSIKFTKHKFITNKYLDFVIPLLDNDPKLAEEYKAGFGIIKLRNEFLQHYGKSGPEILNQELLEELEALNLEPIKLNEDTKFVIIPVATIGCGKTTTAQSLVNIYNDTWAMVSNDDIPSGKSAKSLFVKKSLELLATKRVVILDRNNHQYRERQQIFDDFNAFRDDYISHDTPVQFICLNFVPDEVSNDELWDTTVKRVFARGDNHQSIKASTESAKVRGIMSGFVKRFQPVVAEKEPDSKFDMIIDLDPSGKDSSLHNSKKILSMLQEKYPMLVNDLPSDEELSSGFKKALEYKPSFNKFIGKNPSQETKHKTKSTENKQNCKVTSKKNKRYPTFFSIDLPGKTELEEIIDNLVRKKADDIGIKCTSWKHLQENDKVQKEFHVTLAHVNQGKKGNDFERRVWSDYIKVYESQEGGPGFNLCADISLKKLVWNDKIMTLIIDILRICDAQSKDQLSFTAANKYPHVTVGLLSHEVKPVYSNFLAEQAASKTEDGIYGDNFGDEFGILNWDNPVVLENLPLRATFQ